MAQFKAFAKGVEVNGETVLSVVAGMNVFRTRALRILADHGIVDPKPGHWYSQQAWLDSFKTIAETVGSLTLTAIGRRIPENAKFPPGIDGIEKALRAIDLAYHMNHRIAGTTLFNSRTHEMTEGVGHYAYHDADEKSARMVCDNPYPCEFDFGIIEAMALRFKPSDCLFVKVTHDDSAPCRKKGHDSCTYHVRW